MGTVKVELHEMLGQALEAAPFKMVFSAPRKGCKYTRAELVPRGGGWQLEKRTDTQVFHTNMKADALLETALALLENEFTQMNAFGERGGYSLRITKRGKVLGGRTGAASQTAAQLPQAHNRKKAALLEEGTVIPPLVDMGVFTADGRVVAGMYDKYRQVNRFIELVDDALRGKSMERLHVIDFGCGKSYLTFILYYYLVNIRKVDADIVGLDLKAEVVANCNKAAQRYGYSGLRFEVGDIAAYTREKPVDMVVSLHACDTATDYALAHAVAWGAKMIFSVPCCQHELNSQLHSEAFAILGRYGLLKERMAALMTDAVRANLLTACGYKTQVVEFVELEHTPKNILLRAVRTGLPPAKRREALDEVQRLCEEFSLQPTLLRLLEEQGLLEVKV